MEDIHNLLAVMLKQHYNGRTEIILSAREIIKEYINTTTPNYEKTLSALYNLMNDLPSDILLYFLTTVPLPMQADGNSSHLISLMKQMMGSTFQNKVKPTIVKYLYGNPPPLSPISNKSILYEDNNSSDSLPKVSSTSNDNEETVSSALVEHVKSVIDENIQQNRMGKKRKTRSRNTSKNSQKKSVGVRPLAFICSENIYKNHLFYKSFYNRKKCDAWNLLNGDRIGKKNELQCYEVLRDVNKKIEWLKMFSTGKVPLKVIEEAYKDTEILYLARHRDSPPSIPDDIMEVTPELSNSIDAFLNKC